MYCWAVFLLSLNNDLLWQIIQASSEWLTQLYDQYGSTVYLPLPWPSISPDLHFNVVKLGEGKVRSCLDTDIVSFNRYYMQCVTLCYNMVIPILLPQLLWIFVLLQLALHSVDASVHGNCTCDFTKHTHCTDEHDLHSGQESRPSGVWWGSYFTAYSYGEISFSGT